MKDETVSFKTAKLAKEKGFPQLNEGLYFTKDKDHCLIGWGFDNIREFSAPTQTILHRWLREVKEINVIPPLRMGSDGYVCQIVRTDNMKCFKTYEEALEDAIYEALKLL
jgi:hypothetical protein